VKVYIVIDAPPSGPEPGRFVEVEDEHGASVGIGKWERHHTTGIGEDWWALEIRIADEDVRR